MDRLWDWPWLDSSMSLHIVVVTAESMPNCVASFVLGTEDIDSVCYFALYEMIGDVKEVISEDIVETLGTFV